MATTTKIIAIGNSAGIILAQGDPGSPEGREGRYDLSVRDSDWRAFDSL
jgi:hypothetical protein